MKKMFALLAAASLAWTFSVQAAEGDATAKKPLTPQQQRMKTCNADAKTQALKGDERKAFMKQCLSGKTAAPAAAQESTQQTRMKTCNAEAKTKQLAGDERKAFMKSCLSDKPAA
ncbi:hypothetical protein GCM10022279_20970 [Comamonas faecalis]|uniref:Phosphate starvation-inducible protein PsiF n=1 Tax=Comamonas faecalis TaxID=1387849 RepID=A0ABP7RGL1_9BURK